MIIFDTFISCGNTILSLNIPFLELTSLGYTGSSIYNSLNNDPVGCIVSLITTSISSATINGYAKDDNSINVQNTQMLIESMSLEELYELKDEIDLKDKKLKLR